MAIVYWHDLIGNNKFNDIRNYSTDQAGLTPRVAQNNINSVDAGQPVGSMTITATFSIANRYRTLPARIWIQNNVGLGVDVMLTVNAVLGATFTVDEDITGIDASGQAQRVDIGPDDQLLFSGTGTGHDNDVIVDGPDEFPYNDECWDVQFINGAFNGRLRVYNSGTRKLIALDTFGNNYFTLERGIDRTYAGKINYAASWLWTFSGNHFGDIYIGPEASSALETSLDSPFVGPDLGNDGTTQLIIKRRDTSKPLWYQPLKSACIIDTSNNSANINIEGLNLVLQFPDSVEYLQGTTATLIVSSGGTINVGPFQETYASTNTVDSDTLPTDKDELWLPPIYFVHDWNGAYQITESFETNIRTSQDGTETRREIVDKPYRNLVQASQAWTPSEILLMQALFNRMGSARTLQPIWSDMVHTLQIVTPTTPPYDSARYPVVTPLPANGTSFPIDPSREDIRWRRFYKGMRVLVYDLTQQSFTRMVDNFEIAIIDRVWGEYDFDFPNTYGTIWFESALVNDYPRGTRIVPLVETQIKLDNDSKLANATKIRFPVRMLEDVGRMALPAIIEGGLINDDNANNIFPNPEYATVPSWEGSANAPAAAIIEPQIANWASSPRRKFNRPGQFTKVGKGTIPEIYGNRILNDYAFLNSSLTREQAWSLITLFHSSCGRTNRVYIVNPYMDYVGITLTAVSIIIEKGSDAVDIITRPYIAFKLDYETEYQIRNIVSSTDNGSTLTLTWVRPLPMDNGVINIGDLQCVRSAFLARFKKDDLIQNMITHNVMEVGIQFQDLGSEVNEGLSSVSGQWEVDQLKGTDGIEIIKDTGAFTTTIDTQTISSDQAFGTAEEAVRALVDFELDTDSTCTPLNIFWPVDETFELLRVVFVNINTDGTTYVDIGFGERGNCEDNNYDFDDFVIRVYLTYLGGLWNHRAPAIEPSNTPCPRPYPKDFANWYDASAYVELPNANWVNGGTATLDDLVDTGIKMTQAKFAMAAGPLPVSPQVNFPDGRGILKSYKMRITDGWQNTKWTRAKYPEEPFTFAGYANFPYFLNGLENSYHLIAQSTTAGNGFSFFLTADNAPFKQRLGFFVNYDNPPATKQLFYDIPPALKGQPFHYVIAADSTHCAIYFNGVKVVEQIFAANDLDMTGGTVFTYMGKEANSTANVTDWVGGVGATLLRYARAVTDAEAEAIFLHFSYQNTEPDIGARMDFYNTTISGPDTAFIRAYENIIEFDPAGVGVQNAYLGTGTIYAGDKPKQCQWTFSGDVSGLRVGLTTQSVASTVQLGMSNFGGGIGLDLATGGVFWDFFQRFTFTRQIIAGDVIDIAFDPRNGDNWWRLNGGEELYLSPIDMISQPQTQHEWWQWACGTDNPPTTGLLIYETDPSKFIYPAILAGTTQTPSIGHY